jgi:hypothetical protein
MTYESSAGLAPGRGKPGKEMRKAQGKGFKLLGHCDFGGPHMGDVMQILLKDHYLLCGHIGLSRAGVSVLDVSDSRNPRVVNQIPAPPNTHNTKLQISGDIMIVNNEKHGLGVPTKAGIDIYDISHLPDLRLISFFNVGGTGCHRMWFIDGRYAFLPGDDEGYCDQFLRIVDLSDPSRPEEAGRWWVPGMRDGEEREWRHMHTHKKDRRGQYVETEGIPPGVQPKRVALHTPYAFGDRLYNAWWDSGFIILDISDISNPKFISNLELPPEESASTHSVLVLPERKLCVVVDEFVAYDCEDMRKQIRVVDIADERNPKVLSMLPVPEGDFEERGGRFGPHNLHENRPGSLIDQDHVYQCYFNGGLRVYDIKDPHNPKETAHYVPATPNRSPVHIAMGVHEYEVVQTQVDDIYVAADGRVFLSERLGGGVWILEKEF